MRDKICKLIKSRTIEFYRGPEVIKKTALLPKVISPSHSLLAFVTVQFTTISWADLISFFLFYNSVELELLIYHLKYHYALLHHLLSAPPRGCSSGMCSPKGLSSVHLFRAQIKGFHLSQDNNALPHVEE